MSNEQPTQRLDILRVYLKDASLECPSTPAIFNEQGQPEIQVQLSSNASPVADHVHEAVLSLTLTAKVNGKTAYLVEVQQAGLFAIQGIPDEQLRPVLGIFCPNTLYPFAREAVAELIGKAGFPPLLLNPVNFEHIYLQRLQQEHEQAQASAIQH